MAKKNRRKKRTIYSVIEGKEVESHLLSFINEIYLDTSTTALKVAPIHGGNPDRLIAAAIRNLHCGYDQLFVWIDEDREISYETKISLSKCWRIENNSGFLVCPLKDLQRLHNFALESKTAMCPQGNCATGCGAIAKSG